MLILKFEPAADNRDVLISNAEFRIPPGAFFHYIAPIWAASNHFDPFGVRKLNEFDVIPGR
jgi:hypothetical protein